MVNLSRPVPQEIVVAEIKLEGCPEGEVLSPVEPQPQIDRYFQGWRNALTAPRHWKQRSDMAVAHDRGRAVLSHPKKSDRCLVAGELSWRDYAVEAEVRVLGAETLPNNDESQRVVPWAGIMFRCRDLRHYYFFCLQPPQHVVLYRRADDDWHILGQSLLDIAPDRRYALRTELVGDRIVCLLDGEVVFDMTDYQYHSGKAGVRFNTEAQVASVRVTMTAGARTRHLNIRNAEERRLQDLREQFPKACEAKTLDLRRFWPFQLRLASLRGDEHNWLLLRGGDRPGTLALDADGEVMWELPSLLHIPMLTESSGGSDLFGILEGELVLLDGRTGATLRRAPLPKLQGRELVFRYPTVSCVNLSAADRPREFILREGDDGDTLWAYDADLNLLWSAQVNPRFGHGNSIAFYDVDGDGREEILAGGSLLDADGELIWRMERHEEVNHIHGAGHVDAVALGPFAQDEEMDPVAFLAAGSAGVYVLDALNGRLRAVHRVGHAQGRHVGNFRPDLPGLEIQVGCRWGNYGILNLFSGRGERLCTFEPDNISQGGAPVNWSGDGGELILMTTSLEAYGLWDGWGRKVVELPAAHLPEGMFYGSGASVIAADVLGDPRDELIYVVDGIIRIFGPEGDPKNAKRVYAPRRWRSVSWPRWQGESVAC
jgi:hypothetical protein